MYPAIGLQLERDGQMGDVIPGSMWETYHRLSKGVPTNLSQKDHNIQWA